MVEIVAQCTFPIAEINPEFEGLLRHFHNKCAILHFSQIKSLKDFVILSPCWLAKLISYVITTYSFRKGKGFDDAWKQLNEYDIL